MKSLSVNQSSRVMMSNKINSNNQLHDVGFGSSAGRGPTDKGVVYHDHTVKRMNNISIPAIPSRFLTPILKFDFQEKELSNYDHVVTSVPGGG